jgi:hypothetical protein
MPRPINHKCLQCAKKLEADQARQVHGSEGDDCWVEALCHRRRSQYRDRPKKNERRRVQYRLERKSVPLRDVGMFELEMPAPETLAAFFVFVRRHEGAPVHAIGAEIWQSGHLGQKGLVGRIPLQHTMGMTGPDLTDYLEQMQQKLMETFGIKRFEDSFIEIQPQNCPIVPCPLKPLTHFGDVSCKERS